MNALFKVKDCNSPAKIDGRYVKWDDFEHGDGYTHLWTDEVHSCLALALYERVHRRGVLAHVTGMADEESPVHPANIVDTLVDALLEEQYSDFICIEATLVGDSKSEGSARDMLERLGERHISIIGSHIGKGTTNTVIFNPNTGATVVYSEPMSLYKT